MCPAEQTRRGRRRSLAILAGTFVKRPFERSAETERASAFERRLSTLYANYSDAWRARFGMPVPIARAMPLEQRR